MLIGGSDKMSKRLTAKDEQAIQEFIMLCRVTGFQVTITKEAVKK